MAPHLKIDTYVAAKPERVFALATDFPNAPERVTGITAVEMLTDGPVGVGTRFKETRKMFGKEASETMEVTAFEPPLRYVLEARSHGSHYVSELRCEPEGEGTRFSMTFEATPLTFMAKVMSVLMRPMIKMMGKECLRDLQDIGRAAEAEVGGATSS